jgi:hypothetical protein
MERPNRVTEGAGHLLRRAALDEIGPQSLVHALFSVTGFEEKATATNYVFWCADDHAYMVLPTTSGVKLFL